METFFRITGGSIDHWGFPSEGGRWFGALMFPLMLTWTKCWINSRVTSDFRRYDTHVVSLSYQDCHTINAYRNRLTCIFIPSSVCLSSKMSICLLIEITPCALLQTTFKWGLPSWHMFYFPLHEICYTTCLADIVLNFQKHIEGIYMVVLF